jgi:structure-specific endonuclease subunit SLX1
MYRWSWQNTHVTRHINESDRITKVVKSQKWSRRFGKYVTKVYQPPISLTDKIHNLHLMLRSESFERWPLSVRFFATDVYKVFTKWDETSKQHIRPGIDITLDPLATPLANVKAKKTKKKGEVDEALVEPAAEAALPKQNPLELLDFGYMSIKPHLEKSMERLVPGANIACAVCKVRIEVENSLTLVCPHDGCNATSHMQCMSTEFLRQEGHATSGDFVVPVEGECPSCHTPTKWRTLVQELSLRTRGQKEVEKLFKKPRRKKGDAPDAIGVVATENGPMAEAHHGEVDADEECDDDRRFREFEEEALETASQELAAEKSSSTKRKRHSPVPFVEDSDWDEVEVLD